MTDAVVEGHHHIWRMRDLPWLAGAMAPRIFGDYMTVCRDYPVEEYLRDSRPCGVVKSVYVQTNWAPADAVAEVAWAQPVADRHGFSHATVGYADLAAPDVEETLRA